MKRLIAATPSEMLSMNAQELLQAIKMSEGRTLTCCARVRAGNMVDYVSNAEVVAAFGADIISLDTYDFTNPYIPGWDSKNPDDDREIYDLVQVKLGKGHTFSEIQDIVGRPMNVLMFVVDPQGDSESVEAYYGANVATPEKVADAVKNGIKFINLSGWAKTETIVKFLKDTRKIVGDSVILEFGKAHGPGLMNLKDETPELFTEEEMIEFLKAGADIIGMPAPGTYPTWDLEKCTRLVKTVHKHGGLASLGVHTSQEGAMTHTLEQIALWSKMAGADIHELGDSGNNEQMIDPLNILHYSIAIKGRRHTYRRMAFSGKR